MFRTQELIENNHTLTKKVGELEAKNMKLSEELRSTKAAVAVLESLRGNSLPLHKLRISILQALF